MACLGILCACKLLQLGGKMKIFCLNAADWGCIPLGTPDHTRVRTREWRCSVRSYTRKQSVRAPASVANVAAASKESL